MCDGSLTRTRRATPICNPRVEPARVAGRAGPRDDQHALTLLRRAIGARDEESWAELIDVLDGAVRRWCRHAGAVTPEDIDDLVQLAWARFWHSYTPEKLARATAAAQALQYLKLCVYSVATDDARRRRRSLSLHDERPRVPARDVDTREAAMDEVDRAMLWQIIDHSLRDERERVLMRLVFVEGLPPREVQRRCPDLFPEVREVYRITRNVLDRLRRSPALLAWLA